MQCKMGKRKIYKMHENPLALSSTSRVTPATCGLLKQLIKKNYIMKIKKEKRKMASTLNGSANLIDWVLFFIIEIYL